MSDTLTDEWRTARKVHLCDCCQRRHIQPGDRYRYVTTADQGTVGSWREHVDCSGPYWELHQYAGLYDDEPLDPHEFRQHLDELAKR